MKAGFDWFENTVRTPADKSRPQGRFLFFDGSTRGHTAGDFAHRGASARVVEKKSKSAPCPLSPDDGLILCRIVAIQPFF
jgi:hypothetical protein